MTRIPAEGGGPVSATQTAAYKIEADANEALNGGRGTEKTASALFHQDVVQLAHDDPKTYASIVKSINNYDQTAAALNLPNITIGPEEGTKLNPVDPTKGIEVTASDPGGAGAIGQIFEGQSGAPQLTEIANR